MHGGGGSTYGTDELSEGLQLALSAANLGDWCWDVATLSPRACEIFGMREFTITPTTCARLLESERAARGEAERANATVPAPC